MGSLSASIQPVALVLVLALVAGGCSGGDERGPTSSVAATSPSTLSPTTTDIGSVTTATVPGIPYLYGEGVTPAPCDDAVNDANGCIYLGVIADLGGPFQHVSLPATRAQEDFWRIVNQQGGIGGFDVIISPQFFVDAAGDRERGVSAAQQIAPNVAGIAQASGIESTIEAVGAVFGPNNLVVTPADRWSGWSSDELDGGLALEVGTSYCFSAMNGVYFMNGLVGDGADGPPSDFDWAIVATADLYGGDYAVGARLAADDLGWPEPIVIELPTDASADVLAAASETLATRSYELVVFATDPGAMAIIWAQLWAAAEETQPDQLPLALGAAPSWRESFKNEPDLMFTLVDRYFQTSPWEGWSADSAGHRAMRSAAEESGEAPSHGYLAGWISQYPLKAVIEAAAESGDLTRANLVELAGSIEVDFDDMMAPVSYGAEDADVRSRSTVVNRASIDSEEGLVPMTSEFSSPFVQGFSLSGSCSEYVAG